MFFHDYPYSDAHELNLDWLIRQIKQINTTLSNFIVMNTIKYADPFQWSINTQYESNTIVMEPNTGTAYISVQPVPAGISISNTSFWTPVFDLSQLFTGLNDNLTFNNEYLNILSAHSYAAGAWLIWRNDLYLVTSAISVGNALQPGVNLERKSVEEFIASVNSAISTINGQLGTIVIDINNIKASLDLILSDRCILIGDSFATIKNSDDKTMFEVAKEISGRTCIISSISGASFYNADPALKFITQLQNIADSTLVKDIYVFGGPNDVLAPAQSYIYDEIEAFNTYAKAHFVNAKVHIGFTGYHWNMPSYVTSEHEMVIPAYKQAVDLGIDFIDNFSSVLHSDTFTFDSLHPTSAGVNKLGYQIGRVLMGLPVESQFDINLTITDITALSGVTVGMFFITERINGNVGIITNYQAGSIQFNFDTAQTVSGFTGFATADKNSIYPTENALSGAVIPCVCDIYHGDSTVTNGTLYLFKKFNTYGVVPISGDFTNVIRLQFGVGTAVLPLDTI